jgi:hypothetical protein
MHMYISISYVVTQSFLKKGYSLCSMEKDKTCITKRTILVLPLAHITLR